MYWMFFYNILETGNNSEKDALKKYLFYNSTTRIVKKQKTQEG